MRVFRAQYKDRGGKSRESAKWYVEFKDHLDAVRRVPGFTDKKQTEELGRKLDKLAARRANGESLDVPMARWLESLPERLRERLAEIGLMDSQSVAASKSLAEHLDDFQSALLAKGNTEKHAKLVTSRARWTFEGCGFRLWSDLSASKVSTHLAECRKDSGEDSGLSIQTSNFYLQAAKQFCRWMVRDRRASESPLEHLQGQNVRTDRRHDRRALTLDETRRLLAATHGNGARGGATGPERCLIYRLSLEAGLRASEIISLTRGSFVFGEGPTVTVEAAYSKHRRKDVLPLRPELADAIKDHVGTKLPAAQAFGLANADKAARVIRADLTAARVAWLSEAPTPAERATREASDFLAYRNAAGLVADFHALRHTFITNLANSGVHPKVAQQLARHSTITLTMDRYSHTIVGELSEALAKLPDLCTSVNTLRATGTDGHGHPASSEQPPASYVVLADCLASKGGEIRNLVDSAGVNRGEVAATADNRETPKSPGNTQDSYEINGGSAWESNPPATRFTRRTTVLKTEDTLTEAATESRLPTHADLVLADCLALLDQVSPELAAVVQAWDTLPTAIRAGILAMVKAQP